MQTSPNPPTKRNTQYPLLSSELSAQTRNMPPDSALNRNEPLQISHITGTHRRQRPLLSLGPPEVADVQGPANPVREFKEDNRHCAKRAVGNRSLGFTHRLPPPGRTNDTETWEMKPRRLRSVHPVIARGGRIEEANVSSKRVCANRDRNSGR